MNPNSNRRRGKANERALAKRLGGMRIGLLGKEDISHPIFSFEAKSFARFAGERVIEQAERNAPNGKTPIAIVHIKGNKRDRDMVMMRLTTFEDYLGKVKDGDPS